MSEGLAPRPRPPLGDWQGQLRAHPERVELVGGEVVEVIYPDGTPDILQQMIADPSAVIWCRHGDGPAIEVIEVPDGCVCFPQDVVQALCATHVGGADSFPVVSLVDLT